MSFEFLTPVQAELYKTAKSKPEEIRFHEYPNGEVKVVHADESSEKLSAEAFKERFVVPK